MAGIAEDYIAHGIDELVFERLHSLEVKDGLASLVEAADVIDAAGFERLLERDVLARSGRCWQDDPCPIRRR